MADELGITADSCYFPNWVAGEISPSVSIQWAGSKIFVGYSDV